MRVKGGGVGDWANMTVDGNTNLGCPGFTLLGYTNVQEQYISVGIVVKPEAKRHFTLVPSDTILRIPRVGQSGVRFSPHWTDDPADKEHQGYLTVDRFNTNPDDTADWGVQHEWMRYYLTFFIEVFEDRIKKLCSP
jgi:hypothetical protein